MIALLGIILGVCVNYIASSWGWEPRKDNPWNRVDYCRPWWYKIPVVGWFGMRKEADRFGRGFWIRPLLTEVGMGIFAVWFFVSEVAGTVMLLEWNGIPVTDATEVTLWVRVIFQTIFVALMVAATWIDFDEKTIPDGITVSGTLFALVMSFLFPLTIGVAEDAQTGKLIPIAIQSPTQLLDFPISPIMTGDDILVPMNGASPCPPVGVRRSENDGIFGLVSALVCWWGWCFALMERHWRPRHGFRRAWVIFWERLARTPSTRRLWNLGKWGTLALVMLWATGWSQWLTVWSTLIGIGVAGGFMWLIRLAGKFAMDREAMGFGDVTLMAMFGAFLGWQPCLVLFFIAPFAGLVIGLIYVIVFRDTEIPFGPFLCAAALITMLNWPILWALTLPLFNLGTLLFTFGLGLLLLMVILLCLIQWVKKLLGVEY
ncbi:MAG: A24 family peptidase [Planctomycetia bacterium]|nr:A24 family peptidase [Planctomycetia bacterium]